MLSKSQALVFVISLFAGSAIAGATTSIGTAASRGEMRVDQYLIGGNATLMNGSVVETGKADADLRMGNGITVRMGAGSRATVYSDRLVLDQGNAQVTGGYRIQALGFAVMPARPGSKGMIAIVSGNAVDVGSLAGEVSVFNARGTVLASVGTGKAIELAAAPASGTGVSGIISRTGGRFLITTADGTKYKMVLNGDASLRNSVNSLVKKQATVEGTINGDEIAVASVQGPQGTGSGAPPSGQGTSITPLAIGVAGIVVALGATLALGLESSTTSASR